MSPMTQGVNRSKLSSRKFREAWSKIKGEPNKQYFKRKVQTSVKKITV